HPVSSEPHGGAEPHGLLGRRLRSLPEPDDQTGQGGQGQARDERPASGQQSCQPRYSRPPPHLVAAEQRTGPHLGHGTILAAPPPTQPTTPGRGAGASPPTTRPPPASRPASHGPPDPHRASPRRGSGRAHPAVAAPSSPPHPCMIDAG